MSEFFLTENDRLPTLRSNLSLSDDGFIDLTGGTGYFIYKNKYTTDVPVTGAIDIIGPTSGYCQFQWPSGTAGVFYGRWRIILNGKQISFPNDSMLDFSICEDLHSL